MQMAVTALTDGSGGSGQTTTYTTTSNYNKAIKSYGLMSDKKLRLFGAPYQFTDAVDPIFTSAYKYLGRSYGNIIMSKAPIVTIIPGEADYLPGQKDEVKDMTSMVLISGSTSLSSLLNGITQDTDYVRYYDFKPCYREYYNYVNLLCRAMAALLELDSADFNGTTFTIDGTAPTKYSWHEFADSQGNYEETSDMLSDSDYWAEKAATELSTDAVDDVQSDADSTDDMSGATVSTVDAAGTFGTVLNDTIDELLTDILDGTTHYVQFYVDPDNAGGDESHSNDSTQSTLKSTIEGVQSSFKELAFMMNSGGMGSSEEDMATAIANASSSLSSAFDSVSTMTSGSDTVSGISSCLSRIIGLGGNIVKGENIIIPDIYTSSTYGQSHSFTIHLKALYGSKAGWFWDVGVPLMHLLALAVPKQGSANTYSAPFLVKAYMDGVFSCNLGLVESLSINKSVSSTAWTADGLPNEIDVTITLKDLYSDLTINSAANPTMFYHNTSLVDYLAVTCGLSLVSPNPMSRISMYVGTYVNALSIGSVASRAAGVVEDYIDSFAQTSTIYSILMN